ncbi:hypothetical protein CH063_09211 [Colletotrichum higginsianum]|nr:hypothetical protein CH063_09211 [Colletotrichum higginsianum]
MNKTLWARKQHHLSDRYIVKSDSSEWELAQDDCDYERARRSLIRIEHKSGSDPVDLTAEIQRKFDYIDIFADGSGQSFLARPPVFARILYTPSEDDVDDNLEALQVISIKDQGQEDETLDADLDRLLWRYVLVAAVRLRDRPNGHDKIRLFTPDGADIARSVNGLYNDPYWHVGARGHSYFLLGLEKSFAVIMKSLPNALSKLDSDSGQILQSLLAPPRLWEVKPLRVVVWLRAS